LVLRPLSVNGHWYEFDKPDKFIELGRRVTEEHLAQIQSLVKGRTSTYEHQLAAIG
jgi:hypothetical protein